MTDPVTDEQLIRPRMGPGIGHVQAMILIKDDHPADECGTGLCSVGDQASWPDPAPGRGLTKLDEFRAARIRIAIGHPIDGDI